MDTIDLKLFYFQIFVKLQAHVVICDEFLCVCIVENCGESSEPAFKRLQVFLATHAPGPTSIPSE
jgi:hypothetical protein